MAHQLSLAFTTFLILLSLFWLLKVCRRIKPQKKVQELPPGPRKLPLIGNLHNLIGSLPHHALQQLAGEHGPLMHLQLGEISAIVVSSPRLAREVMQTHDLAFAQRPEILAPKIISYGGSDIAFSPYGDYWRQMRKVCMLELLSAKRVKSFSSLREEEISNLIESIHSSSGSPINFTEKICFLTSSIVCRTAFGTKCKDQDEFTLLTRDSAALAGGFDIADLFPSKKFLHVVSGLKFKLEKIHGKVDKILDKIINDHRENPMSAETGKDELWKEDLVDVLLRLQLSGSLEFPITTNNIKVVILDMFAAGTDTSSTVIDWAMSEMMRQPRVLEKAQAEIRRAFNGKKQFHEKDIQNLSYLKLVIKETLRLHPPVAMLLPRECREPCEIDGYEIPLKTKVIVNAWAIGRDPALWHDAESFIPERFANSSIDFNGTHLEYIPFGAGRRMCPGITFGMVNVELPLAQLLYHFDWELPGRMRPEDLDMTEFFGAVVRRKNNLYLVAAPYSPSE
ncbi:hypothetical protein ACJW30_12G157700 [Castanea mollissima]